MSLFAHPFIPTLLVIWTTQRREKPALPPRPNRMLGGTNLRADMAPVRSSISTSGTSRRSLVAFALVSPDSGLSAAGAAFGLPSADDDDSAMLALLCSSFILACRPDDFRLCPYLPSCSNDCLPSMPSRVTAKKKFFGYMCLSIKWRRRLSGVAHFLSHPSTKHVYCR